MMPESDENRLDQSLRSKFEDFDLPPGAPVWAGIAARLGPPPKLRPRRRPWLVPLLVLTALVAGLGGWLLPRGARQPSAVASGKVEAATKPLMAGEAAIKSPAQSAQVKGAETESPTKLLASEEIKIKLSVLNQAVVGIKHEVLNQSLATGRTLLHPHFSPPTTGVTRDLAGTTPMLSGRPDIAETAPPAAPVTLAVASREPDAAAVPAALPVTLRALAALERQTLEQLPSIATLAPGTLRPDRRAALLTNLRTERAELFRLQRRTDSLLLALGDLPAAPTLAARPDSTQPATKNRQPETSRWSILLTGTPEQNTLALKGPEGDSLTALRLNHETGRAGFSAGLLAEYKLTPRLSVGGGVGYTSFGADLRITNKTTLLNVRYDSAGTSTVGVFTSTNQTYSIRIVQQLQFSPVFGPGGQIIRYDSVYVPRQDTVFTNTVRHNTIRTNNTTFTPIITKKEAFTTKLLQPNYRFFTVPVLLRYRLAAPSTTRFWTDVAVGAQLQFFLGGTQVATDDGKNFRTERITVASSPFRALNVALSGSLALNYALTPRLSVSVAPSMRWQALSLYKPETGLRQQATATGLMFGVRFGM